MKSSSAAATLLLALVHAACAPPGGASPDAGPAPDDAGPLSPLDYCESIEPFFCAFYLRCGRMAGVTSAEECRAVFLEQCNGRYEPRYAALEGEGLLSLSRAGIERCAAHLDDVECAAQLRDLDGPCGAMWVGAQPEGGACGLDVESLVCAPGTACALGLDFCGECRRVVDVGRACGAAAAEPVSCGTAASCIDGECVARVAVGGQCTPDESCVVGARCEGERCVGPSYVGPAEACDQARRCRYKSHCDDGFCVEDALVGESCAVPTGCASGWCGDDVTCQPLLTFGEACERSEQCVSGLCANAACAPMPGACFAG